MQELSKKSMFEEKARTKALELALGLGEADTIGLALEQAEKIHVFFTEGTEDELDLRVRAVLAACTVAIRSEGDLHACLIATARLFLAFLSGSISSTNRVPCASAEPRSGVE